MKIKQALNLLALTTILSAGAALAQTTPTATATSTTYPTGAVAPDSTPASGRSANRAGRKRNRTASGRATSGRANGNAGGSQDAQYRQSSSANGTSINNSNSTNYNSNNATNAPTGVGSNPATTTTTPTSSTNDSANNPDLSRSGSTSSGSTMSGGSSMSAGSAPKPGAATGTGMAVKAARTTEEPAVAAGSTNRSTSIGDFVASSPNFTTLQNALQSAGLSETLKGTGPFTVFAPSNSAFKKLPTAAQNILLEGRNRAALANLLSYHVVNGSVDAAELKRQIKAGNGKARLETLTGGTLTAQMGSNGQITLTDEQGGTARVDAADNTQTNGVIHGIDGVLLPKGGTTAFR